MWTLAKKELANAAQKQLGKSGRELERWKQRNKVWPAMQEGNQQSLSRQTDTDDGHAQTRQFIQA